MTRQAKPYKGTTLFTCDDCGDEIEVDSDDFWEANDLFKSEGGTFRRDSGEWEHICPCCNPYRR